MIKLNLLPPEEKKILALEKARRWVMFYGSALIGLTLVLAVLLSAIWLYVHTQLKTADTNLVTAQASVRGQDLKNQQNLITQLNNKLAKINALQKKRKYFSPLLASLAELVPSGVHLEGLSLSDQGTAVLSGFAQKREQFLIFKQALESSPLFTDVASPLTNLTSQTDLTFSLQFKFNPETLNK